MAEKIDIFNANLEPIGSMERLKAHMTGQWHRTFHLWIATQNPVPSVLYQLRSPTAKNFPNMLDITAAGHLHAGESVEQGVREVQEELGVTLSLDATRNLGYRVEVADQPNGQLNREYQAVFIAQDDRLLASYSPDPEEVYGLIALPIDSGMALHSGEIETTTVPALRYESGTWENGPIEITRGQFLPRIQNYYLTIHIMAERLLNGERYLGIS